MMPNQVHAIPILLQVAPTLSPYQLINHGLGATKVNTAVKWCAGVSSNGVDRDLIQLDYHQAKIISEQPGLPLALGLCEDGGTISTYHCPEGPQRGSIHRSD